MKHGSSLLSAAAAAVAAGAVMVAAAAIATGSDNSGPTSVVAPAGVPSLSASGELEPGSIAFLGEVTRDGTKDPQSIGWSPSSQAGTPANVSALAATSGADGTAVVGVSSSGDVCLALILSDWQPSACAPLNAAAIGRLIIDVQADSSSPRLIAGILPDGARVSMGGRDLAVVNNVWMTSASTPAQDLTILDANGNSIKVELGPSL